MEINMAKQYVVIGVSAGGISALAKLRQLDADATIIALSEEAAFPYNKCFLVEYVSGAKTTEQIYTKVPSFFTDNRIDLRLGTKAVSINREQKTVVCHDGTNISYDALLLAVGGSVRTLSLGGIQECEGVFSFYTYEQARTVKEWAAKPTTKSIIIVGAGLSGLECADALLAYNEHIMVIDTASRPLPHHTTQKGGAYLMAVMQQAGVIFRPQENITQVICDQGKVTGIVVSSGKTYQADMVVIAIGAQPNLALAQQAGLATQQQAVVTNSFLQTSDPAIFAAGDCALVPHALTGLPIRSTTWPDAMMQGMVAATNMVGKSRVYPGIVPLLSSSFFGQKFHTGGLLQQYVGDVVVEQTTADGYYFVRFDRDKKVLGFNLIGNVTNYIVDLKRSLTTGCVYQGTLLDN